MPSGKLKNTIYAIGLHTAAYRSRWKHLSPASDIELERILKKHNVIGGQIATIQKGVLSDQWYFGKANLEKDMKVCEDTVFRIASLSKSVTALLVMRLQTIGLLRVEDDISDYLGYQVRNPYYPDIPITLGMLLSHTASIADSELYYSAMKKPVALEELLADPKIYLQCLPGTCFSYSNLGAGMIGSLLEFRFKKGIEQLLQEELFKPLNISATLCTGIAGNIADCYRIFPRSHAWIPGNSKFSYTDYNPDYHYFGCAGAIMVSASQLALLFGKALWGEIAFLDDESKKRLMTPVNQWPDQRMKHAMGLLRYDDPEKEQMWGHQGFAYGCVNGFFFDKEGNGFFSMNNGADERRDGRMSMLNLDLINWHREYSSKGSK